MSHMNLVDLKFLPRWTRNRVSLSLHIKGVKRRKKKKKTKRLRRDCISQTSVRVDLHTKNTKIFFENNGRQIYFLIVATFQPSNERNTAKRKKKIITLTIKTNSTSIVFSGGKEISGQTVRWCTSRILSWEKIGLPTIFLIIFAPHH